MEMFRRPGFRRKCLSILKSLYNNQRRRISTIGGYTDWIGCERGVKQGGVLSPMLFALYIAKLGDTLSQERQGVEVGEVNIPGLFFADDMALTAETENNLVSLLEKLKSFTTDKRLEINYEKSKIIKLGPGTGQENKWAFEDINGRNEGTVEANFYNYLGILLGKSRTQYLRTKKEIENQHYVPMMLTRVTDRFVRDYCKHRGGCHQH